MVDLQNWGIGKAKNISAVIQQNTRIMQNIKKMSYKCNVLKGKKVIDGSSKLYQAGKQLGFYQQFCN